MELKRLRLILEERKDLLERKLESKKKPHCNGVNPNIMIETEAKLEEIEWLLDLIQREINNKGCFNCKNFEYLDELDLYDVNSHGECRIDDKEREEDFMCIKYTKLYQS